MHDPASPQRQGYTYREVAFSADGHKAWKDGVEYQEVRFPAGRVKRFNIAIVGVILLIFPGMPLLAHFGLELLQRYFMVGFAVFAVGLFWFSRRIHLCTHCNRGTDKITTPHDGAPVLFFCRRCRIYFEHGQIEGGWPWR